MIHTQKTVISETPNVPLLSKVRHLNEAEYLILKHVKLTEVHSVVNTNTRTLFTG